MEKSNNNLYFHIGIGIVCFIIGASQIYRGFELLDYLPIIIIGFCVIASGYSANKRNK